VEIDPEIIEVGRRFFAMNEPNLNAVAQDGRYFLAHRTRKYDVVVIDAYRPPYIPFHLTTREFFSQVRDHLTDEGVVAVNVGRTDWDYSLIEIISGTMRDVFPSVYVIDPFDYGSELANSLVVATRRPTKAENVEANMALMKNPLLLDVARRAVNHIQEVETSTVVFTDDRAPIEQATHRLILRYLLGKR
jgi:spermidine synthase